MEPRATQAHTPLPNTHTGLLNPYLVQEEIREVATVRAECPQKNRLEGIAERDPLSFDLDVALRETIEDDGQDLWRREGGREGGRDQRGIEGGREGGREGTYLGVHEVDVVQVEDATMGISEKTWRKKKMSAKQC